MEFDETQVNIQNLIDYLSEQNQDRVFPIINSHKCPVASFIHERLGVPCVSVGSSDYGTSKDALNDPYTNFILTNDLQRFVLAHDTHAGNVEVDLALALHIVEDGVYV